MPPKNKDTRKTNESPSAGGKEKKSPSKDGDSSTEEITEFLSSASRTKVVKKKDEAGGKGKKSSSEDEVVKKKDEAGGKEKKSSNKDGDSRTEEIIVSMSHLSTSEGEVAPPVLSPDELKGFFTGGLRKAYLVVKYTSPEIENFRTRIYRSGGTDHTEKEFLDDVGGGVIFPKDSTFELFSNFSPCPVRKDGKPCCCDLLQNTEVFDGRPKPKIYYHFLFRGGLDKYIVRGKFDALKSNGFAVIQQLCKEQLMKEFNLLNVVTVVD